MSGEFSPEMIIERSVKVEELCRKTKPYRRPDRHHFSTLFTFLTSKKHFDDIQQPKVQSDNQSIVMTNTTTHSRKHSSYVKDLTKLEPILLRQMEVNKIHYGKYLECILVEDPFVINAKQFLITDTEQMQLEFLNIYNFDVDLNEGAFEEFQMFLSKGSKIIIKEPYLKICGFKSPMEFCLRVDSPTDVIIVEHGYHDAFIK